MDGLLAVVCTPKTVLILVLLVLELELPPPPPPLDTLEPEDPEDPELDPNPLFDPSSSSGGGGGGGVVTFKIFLESEQFDAPFAAPNPFPVISTSPSDNA